jgi:hypothetical protein
MLLYNINNPQAERRKHHVKTGSYYEIPGMFGLDGLIHGMRTHTHT